MPHYRVTWTSVREGKDAAAAIEASKPRESLRKDGSFLDPGLPRADEVVLHEGAWVLKEHLELQRMQEERLRTVTLTADGEGILRA